MKFAKNDTLMVKGVAISLMLFHHLFIDPEVIAEYGVVFPLLGPTLGAAAGQLTKICVFMFVFLSAYGITRSTAALRAGGQPQPLIDRRLTAYSLRRVVTIMAGYLWAFALVYAFAWVGRGLPAVTTPDPPALYGTGASGLLYTLIDAAGLAFLLRGPFLVSEWWFWSIALLIALAMPAFLRWYRRSGVLCILIMALLANWIYMLDREGIGHLTALPLGIACAEGRWLERFRTWRPFKGEGRGPAVASAAVRLAMAGAAGGFCLLFAATGISFYLGYQYATLPLVFLCWQLLGRLPVITPLLAFLGRHSMNIFLVHTVVMRAVPGFFYGPRYAPFCWALLMAASLVLSILFEAAKKLLRYDRLAAGLCARADAWGKRLAPEEAI